MAAEIVIWLNALASAVIAPLLAPIGILPGWLSVTLIAAVTGVLMLLAFKYTSNQSAIRRTRNDIKANLLALSLFKDSIAVGLRAQGRILLCAGRLLLLSLVPMFVMIVPMCLLLGQLSLWYQARPLRVGEETVVSLQLSENGTYELPEVKLIDNSAMTTTIGPVRVPSKRLVCWSLQASSLGFHRLEFVMDGQTYEKELVVGNGFMRTSLQRPPQHWTAALLHPGEEPFAESSPVQSIEIAYPQRQSWTAGTNSWVVYWFAASMCAAFLAKPILKVHV